VPSELLHEPIARIPPRDVLENEKDLQVMLYRLGRLPQLLGLILLPIGIAGNVARPEEITLWRSLSISAAGVLCFFIGWLLQQGRAP
jgi:hypothetical protein